MSEAKKLQEQISKLADAMQEVKRTGAALASAVEKLADHLASEIDRFSRLHLK